MARQTENESSANFEPEMIIGITIEENISVLKWPVSNTIMSSKFASETQDTYTLVIKIPVLQLQIRVHPVSYSHIIHADNEPRSGRANVSSQKRSNESAFHE